MKIGYWDVPLTAREIDDELDSTTAAPAINFQLVYLFIAFNLIGLVGMLLMVTTATISRRVKRLSTWYSFCVSWILSCGSYLLLFLTGQQSSLNPVNWVCYTQSALIYAMPPTTSCTTLALLVHILMSFPDTTAETPIQVNLKTSCCLLLGPYSIFLVIFIGVALFTSRNPATLQKANWGTYCHSTNADWARISWIVVAVVSMAIIVVQGQLAARLYSNLNPLRRGSQSSATMLRGMLFTLIGFINLVVAMVLVFTNVHSLTFDIIISLFPILGLIVFGSQMDLLTSWVFWKRTYSENGAGGAFVFTRNHTDKKV